ncbi:MAG: TolC family protein, partial [Candidatus Omnitrophica bacterium]|nr:TolC family protein [Candidatus Omnitrophota bacterium]
QDINNKVNRVNTMENQVNLFKSIVAVHKKKLDIEIKRLNSGRSNSDTLIRYEEDLLNARLSLANSLFNYRISNLDLELAQNLLLDKYWKGEL